MSRTQISFISVHSRQQLSVAPKLPDMRQAYCWILDRKSPRSLPTFVHRCSNRPRVQLLFSSWTYISFSRARRTFSSHWKRRSRLTLLKLSVRLETCLNLKPFVQALWHGGVNWHPPCVGDGLYCDVYSESASLRPLGPTLEQPLFLLMATVGVSVGYG